MTTNILAAVALAALFGVIEARSSAADAAFLASTSTTSPAVASGCAK